MRVLLTLICLLLGLPVLGVLGAWLAFDAAAWGVLAHQAQTVLGGYALQSLLLAAFERPTTTALFDATHRRVGQERS